MGRIRGDLLVRSFHFAATIIELARELPEGTVGWSVGRQLVNSGTSVGANLREADQAISVGDFVYRCAVGRKEASETEYWLELCVETGLLSSTGTRTARSEAAELKRILGAIVWKTRDHLAERHSAATGRSIVS